MSSTPSAIEAFNIGSTGVNTATGLNLLIVGLIFSALFLVFAYILIKLFDELKEGNLKFSKLSMVVVRMLLVILILGYFLLR